MAQILKNSLYSGIESPKLFDIQLKECNMLGGFSIEGIKRYTI